METKVNYSLVGGFVLTIGLAIVAAILWLSKVGDAQNSKYFTVYFKQHSLSGLQKDSYVLMKGIKVGSVSKYHVSKRNIEEVNVLLRLEEDTPVKADTRAVVNRNLLTGLATVELIGSTQDSAFLDKAPPNEQYPIIPEGTSSLEKITDSLPGFLDQAGVAVNRLSAFASDENIELLHQTLKNIQLVTQSFADNRQQIDAALKSVETVSKDISKITADLSKFTTSTDQRLGAVTRDAQAALQSVQATFGEFKTQTNLVAKSITNSSQVFSHEMVVIAQSISDAADSFAKTIEAFEDPRGIITGPRENALGPGEKIKK